MLRGLDFYKRSVELANQYRKPHQRILHTMQTNGTLIDDEWAAFFKQHNYLVGLSIDGPRELHDAYRIDKKGEGSFDDVIRGWNCLRAARRRRQHPLHDSRRQRRPPARGLPLLPRRAAGASTSS